MARSFARVKATVWTEDRDWRALPAQLQWGYVMLISQAHINNCGVLPYVPMRWARYAAGLTTAVIRETVFELDRRGFVVVDEATGELLVRSFFKHDEVGKQPKLVISAVRQFDEIESLRIRQTLAAQYPDHFKLRAHEQGLPEPLFPEAHKQAESEDLSKDLSEGVSEGVNARAREGQDLDFSPLPASLHQQPAPNGDAAAVTDPKAFEEVLRGLKWRPKQITAALADIERAQAWVAAALNSAETNTGGYAWSGFDSGDWPPARHERRTKRDEAREPIAIEDAWQRFVTGHSWDESFSEDMILEELEARRRSDRTTGQIDTDQALDEWRTIRARRYPHDAPEPTVGAGAARGERE